MCNGSEFAKHQRISKKLKTNIYFARPYKSSDRGLNEHTNGLIRQFLPKKFDFKDVSDHNIKIIQNFLNSRPRKVLNFLAPVELILDLKNTTAVAFHSWRGDLLLLFLCHLFHLFRFLFYPLNNCLITNQASSKISLKTQAIFLKPQPSRYKLIAVCFSFSLYFSRRSLSPWIFPQFLQRYFCTPSLWPVFIYAHYCIAYTFSYSILFFWPPFIFNLILNELIGNTQN